MAYKQRLPLDNDTGWFFIGPPQVPIFIIQ